MCFVVVLFANLAQKIWTRLTNASTICPTSRSKANPTPKGFLTAYRTLSWKAFPLSLKYGIIIRSSYNFPIVLESKSVIMNVNGKQNSCGNVPYQRQHKGGYSHSWAEYGDVKWPNSFTEFFLRISIKEVWSERVFYPLLKLTRWLQTGEQSNR